jgi:hypothetical protein
MLSPQFVILDYHSAIILPLLLTIITNPHDATEHGNQTFKPSQKTKCKEMKKQQLLLQGSFASRSKIFTELFHQTLPRSFQPIISTPHHPWATPTSDLAQVIWGGPQSLNNSNE